MQMVYHKPLYEITQGNNEFRRPADADNRMDDFVIIRFLILHLFLFRNQFLNNIGKILGKGLPHLGTGIFGGYALGHLHQPVKGDFKPVLQVFLAVLLLHDQLQLLLWIINQCRQAALIPAA